LGVHGALDRWIGILVDSLLIQTPTSNYVNTISSISTPSEEPRGIVIYKDCIWNYVHSTGSVYCYNRTNGQVLNNFITIPDAAGIAIDNNYLWISQESSKEIYKYDLQGNLIMTTSLPVTVNGGITCDEESFWISDLTSDKIYQVSKLSLEIINILESPCKSARGLYVINDYLIVGDNLNSVYLISKENGTIYNEFAIYCNDVWGVSIDHFGYVWVSSESGNRVIQTDLQLFQFSFATDFDSDGISDSWELFYGLDPFNPDDTVIDIDGDGLTNIYEYQFNTDPTNVDSDNDNLVDADEILVYDTNPLCNDTDDDGLPDGWEIDNDLNPLTDDANEDPDGDGLTNIEEYSIQTSPVDLDTDNDGLPDGWEVNNGLDPLTDDANGDPDDDGLINIDEYIKGTDPLDDDTDDDGLIDGDEVTVYSTDPLDDDTDDDGLIDGDEVTVYSTDPLDDDTDDDGYTDKEEIDSGTDPCDADSYPSDPSEPTKPNKPTKPTNPPKEKLDASRIVWSFVSLLGLAFLKAIFKKNKK